MKKGREQEKEILFFLLFVKLAMLCLCSLLYLKDRYQQGLLKFSILHSTYIIYVTNDIIFLKQTIIRFTFF